MCQNPVTYFTAIGLNELPLGATMYYGAVKYLLECVFT